MITRRVVRIKADWLRVPVWSLWFPFALADMLVTYIAAGAWRRIFRARFWHIAAAVFVAGIDGIED